MSKQVISQTVYQKCGPELSQKAYEECIDTPLPPNNVSQQLYNAVLPNCIPPAGSKNFTAPKCCNQGRKLQQWFEGTPRNLWNTASNWEGGQAFGACTEEAFVKQCLMSQHFSYLSKNNSLPPVKK